MEASWIEVILSDWCKTRDFIICLPQFLKMGVVIKHANSITIRFCLNDIGYANDTSTLSLVHNVEILSKLVLELRCQQSSGSICPSPGSRWTSPSCGKPVRGTFWAYLPQTPTTASARSSSYKPGPPDTLPPLSTGRFIISP